VRDAGNSGSGIGVGLGGVFCVDLGNCRRGLYTRVGTFGERELGGLSLQRFGEPHVIVELNIEGGFERVWDRCVITVEVSEIRAVKGFDGPDSWGKKRKVFSVVFESWAGRLIEFLN